MLDGHIGRSRAVALAVLAAVLVAGIVLAATAGSNTSAVAQTSLSTPATEGFAVFSKPGGEAGNVFAANPSLNPAHDPASARKIAASSREVWASSTGKEICVMATSAFDSQSGGEACAKTEVVRTDGLFLTSHPSPVQVKEQSLAAGATDVVGLVPDGVDVVEVQLSDSSSKTVNVKDNGFAATFARGARTVDFRTGSGVLRHVKIGG